MQQKQSFPVEVAVRYGLENAILLQCLGDWLIERRQDTDYRELNGRGWLRIAFKQFQGAIPYLSPFKIQSALDSLVADRLLLCRDIREELGYKKRRVLCYSLSEIGWSFLEQEAEA